MSKEKFVIDNWDNAEIAGKRFGINPIVILAQAGLESAWGQSYSATARKNFFGIIAAGRQNEFWGGAKSVSSASGLTFRIYSSPLNSFLDFARLISSKYKTAAKASNDYLAYSKAIASSPYISESNGDNRVTYQKMVHQFAKDVDAIAKKKGLPPLQ